MAYDRRTKAEQLELVREDVKRLSDALGQRAANTGVAIARAKASLEVLRVTLAKMDRVIAGT
jgi:hypothetical protein